jgi:hypothetical protein
MIKNNFFLPAMFVFMLFSCSEDEQKYNDTQSPEVNLSASEAYSEPGRIFHITGTVSDETGIASIHLLNADWYLDKTITFKDTLITKYELDYKFKAPENASVTQNHVIKVTVADVGGNTKSIDQLVNLNGDFDAPTLDAPLPEAITVLIKENTLLNLNFTVKDNKGLSAVFVKCDELSIFDEIHIDGLNYNYSKSIPLKSETGAYQFTVSATDRMNNKMESNFEVNVSELPDFQVIYLTDCFTKESLNANLVGGAIPAKRTAPFTYEIAYYAKQAGQGVYFIPQNTDLQPICFGVSPDSQDKLADDPNTSLPVTLSEVGYYNLRINTMQGTYSVEKYTPNTPVYGLDLKIGIAGCGFPDYPDQNWSPAQAILLEQDAANPYILYKVLDMVGTVQMTLTPLDDRGWWLEPFWRLEQDGGAPLQSGSNGRWEVKNRTTYRFELDTHLQRARILGVNK